MYLSCNVGSSNDLNDLPDWASAAFDTTLETKLLTLRAGRLTALCHSGECQEVNQASTLASTDLIETKPSFRWMFDKGFGRNNHARQSLRTRIGSWYVLTSGVTCLQLKRHQKSLTFDTGHHWTSLDITGHHWT